MLPLGGMMLHLHRTRQSGGDADYVAARKDSVLFLSNILQDFLTARRGTSLDDDCQDCLLRRLVSESYYPVSGLFIVYGGPRASFVYPAGQESLKLAAGSGAVNSIRY